ncbi:MAG: glycosyltransferase family 4 protein [Acidimicrobiia bacterium]
MTTPNLVIYSDATQRGGAEVHVATLLSALSSDISVTLLGSDPGILNWIGAHRPGTEVVTLRRVRNKTDLAALREHRQSIKGLRPTVFQANLSSLSSCQYALAAAETITGLPVVAVENSVVAPPSRISRALKRWTSRRLAAHVGVGDAMSRDVERIAGLPLDSIITIYNGVGDADLRHLPRYSNDPTIGTIGRLDPIKGTDVLLRALHQLPGASAVIVGDGIERSALEDLARRLGVDGRVHWTGWSDVARDHLTTMDVFVLPSRSEGTPLVAIEAMLAGLPVVASGVGSVPEVVSDEETGLIVPPGDPDALGRALRRLIHNPDLAGRMGRSGRDRALERFSPERMASEYEQLYQRLAPGGAL